MIVKEVILVIDYKYSIPNLDIQMTVCFNTIYDVVLAVARSIAREQARSSV